MAVSDSLRQKLLSIFRTPEVTDEVVQTLNDGLILPESEGGIPTVTDITDLPTTGTAGQVYVVNNTRQLYVFRTGVNRWYPTGIVSGGNGVVVSQTMSVAPNLITSTVAVNTSVPYSPTTPEDWDTQPTSIQEALDLLAARVKALEP